GSSPIDHLRELSPDAPTQAFRDFLGKWYFPGDRAFESIDGLSGGERARLALALIAWKQPNVLLLDEPTNHLDLDMREALAEALSDFDGAIVLVSHDRHLIGLVSDTFWRVSDGVVKPFDGDLDEYAAWLRARPAGEQARAPASARAPEPVPPPAPAKPAGKPNPHRVGKAEAKVARLEQALAEVEAMLADPATWSDRDRAATRGQRQVQLHADLDAAENDLLALYGCARAAGPHLQAPPGAATVPPCRRPSESSPPAASCLPWPAASASTARPTPPAARAIRPSRPTPPPRASPRPKCPPTHSWPRWPRTAARPSRAGWWPTSRARPSPTRSRPSGW